MVTIDTTILALAGTWALVVGTIVLMYWQTRQAQQLNSANVVMVLRERFDSTQLRIARRRLSAQLLAGGGLDLPDFQVPSFFELAGAMVRRGVLDKTLVWHAFGGWVENYYYALCHPIDRVKLARESLHDPLIMVDFEWLNEQMVKIDRRRLGDAYRLLLPREEESRRILSSETTLGLGEVDATAETIETRE